MESKKLFILCVRLRKNVDCIMRHCESIENYIILLNWELDKILKCHAFLIFRVNAMHTALWILFLSVCSLYSKHKVQSMSNKQLHRTIRPT